MILIAARFAHYGASAILFGATAYGWYAARRAEPDSRLIRIAAVVALISALVWLAAKVAALSGNPAGAFQPAILALVVSKTDFGKLWAVRLVCAFFVLIAAFDQRLGGQRSSLALTIGAGLLLAGLAGTGHAVEQDGFHRTADIAHLLAAGAWLGGLCALARRIRNNPVLHRAEIERFSKLALCAVVVLVATGVANAVFLLGWHALFEDAYGRVLNVKVALVVAMIGAAAISRRRLALSADPPAIRRTIIVEQAFGTLVLLATSLLGTLSPNGE